MFDPHPLIEKIHALPHGEARLSAVSDAMHQADEAQAHYWRLYFRYEYLTESNIYGDNFKGLLCFPEYLRIFDEHPELEEDMSHDVMWAFKWLLDNAADFYQISMEQILDYFEEFKLRSQAYGLSLRTYYMKRAKFDMAVNPDAAQISYANFKHYPRSRNSDCEACECNFDMEYYLSQNDIKSALEIAQPILNGEKTCAEIPHVTYAELAHYYFYHDQPTEAEYYALLCERKIQNRPEFLKEKGYLLEIYSVTDPGHGWKLLKYALGDFMRCKNPMMRMTFARGAYHLITAAAKSTEYAQSGFLSVLPVAREEEGWNMKTLADFFYEIADDIALRLDHRNQNQYYQTMLKKPLPDASASAQISEEQKQPQHGLIKRQQSQFVTVLPYTAPSAAQMEEKIRASLLEVLSMNTEENTCICSVMLDQNPLDLILVSLPEEDAQPLIVETANGFDPDDLENLLKIPYRMLLVTELPAGGQKSYYLIMKLLAILFPEMLGVISITAMKAFSPAWVQFAGNYESVIRPKDVYSIYIAGKAEDLHMNTFGLASLGMRELELSGANADNFGHYAALLDRTAAFCVENENLPDEGQIITMCYDSEMNEYPLKWQNITDALKTLPPDSTAVKAYREIPSGMLITEGLPAPKEIELTNTRREFFRTRALTKETFEIFQKIVRRCESALVKLEIELNEEMIDQYDYSIELLFAEIDMDETEKLIAVMAQESEAVPEYAIGDRIEVTQDNIVDWRIRTSDGNIFTPEELYLLQGADL